MSRCYRSGGYILLPVMIVIAVVAAVALLMSRESALETNVTAREHQAEQARYVAEAGINHGLWQARQQGCGPYTDFTNQALGPDRYSTSLTTDLGTTTAITIPVDQDSSIRDDNPASGAPTDPTLRLRFNSGTIERPLYRYDLTAIAVGTPIVAATAWFYVNQPHPEGAVDIHPIGADWTEASANWNLLGGAMDPAVLARIEPQAAAGVWVSVNLTALVQAWVNGQANYGILLDAASDGINTDYASRESANAPYLQLVTGTPPSPAASLKSVGTLANGVSRSILREVVLQQNPDAYTRLQPGPADGKDAEIWDQRPNNNYGAAAETWVSSASNDTTRSLLQFNIGEIPAGARILAATLSLARQSGSGADQPVSAHRLLNPWSEATVTWNERTTGTGWTAAGADFDPNAVATTPVGPVNQRYQWDLTPLVQGWVEARYPNYGVILVAGMPGMAGERFHTSEDADPTLRPRLTVRYRCACGVVCLAPQGSGKIVMIGDWQGFSPDPRDQEKEAIIESWGYQVDQADDDFIWAINFNNYDLVYVSETARSSAVGSQLSNEPIGIVNEEGNLNPQLELADGKGTRVGNSIDIVDTSHYITTPFAPGLTSIYSAEMELLTVTGSLAGGLQTLAMAGGVDSLVTLDLGAATKGGGPAPGRRVGLPLGRATNSNFDWSYLNSNGRLLVQRAIEWASGGGNLPPIGELLLVVGNDTSLTAEENARKTLFESWNYVVNIIDEDDPQAAFDAALALNDVVFIPEDVNAADLNTKLTNATIGVVTEEANLSDELGVAASVQWGSSQTLAIDNAHYITQPLASGSVPIFDSSQSVASLTGPFAPDLLLLGVGPDGPALAAIESGASVTPSGNAPGRRVFLPWGGNSFNLASLNADGLTILQRSLAWAADQPAVLGPIAYWKLDEAGGNIAVDSAGGHDGSVANPLWLPGRIKSGLGQTAADNEVIVPHDDTLSLTQKLTLMGWIYAKDLVSYDAAIAKATTGSDLNYFLGTWENELVFGFSTPTDNWQGFYSAGANLQPGTWYHIAASFDNANDTVKLYLDGALLQTFATALEPVTNGGPVLLGRSAINDERLNGILDEARIYDRVLSDAEVAAAAQLPGPVAHWKLDETGGTTAVDAAGGNDGSLINWPVSPDWVAGRLGGGLSFDGNNDYIDVSSMNPLAYDDFTIAAWYQSADTSVSDDEYIFVHDDNFVDEFTFGPTDDPGFGDRLRLGLNRGGAWDPHYGTSDITDQQWHHLVAVRSAGRIKLYVDGVQEANGVDAHAGMTLTIDGDGPFIGDYPGVTEQVHGVLDDVRFYDRGLDASEVSELYVAGSGGGASYTEMYQQWSATAEDTWQTVSLAGFGVPANAVVEVAITNTRTGAQRWGGVRAVGSGLERRFLLHEAEGGGADVVTLHVQANAGSEIQHYSDKKAEVKFTLLGYWTGATYVELFDQFEAANTNSWDPKNLAGAGVGPDRVAEIVVANTSGSNERLGGVRAAGSSAMRRLSIHEAESGGVDAVTLQVNTDGASDIEVYASSGDIDFYLVGYWDTPPGTYTEAGGVHGQATVAASWQTVDLSGFGVPPNSVAQFVLSNERDTAENQIGLRANGSTINNRRLDLQEAEAGGADLASMHVNVDAGSRIQWVAEYGATEGFFYPVGWWVLSP